MNINAKVAQDKQRHPERFCPVARCLWKVLLIDHTASAEGKVRRVPAPGCDGGYCPRHQHLRPASSNWEARVQALENEGLTRSDAQAVVDAEDQRKVRPCQK